MSLEGPLMGSMELFDACGVDLVCDAFPGGASGARSVRV